MTEVENEEKKDYEERLRRRLKILQQQFKEGKVKIAEGLKVEESLLAIRTGPDGEIDLDTVDGLVRSMALAVTSMHDREELKKSISLSEIQNTYFNFIEQNFGHFYKIMIERGLSPHDAGMAAIQSQGSIDELNAHADKFLGVIDEFWEQTGDIAHIHIEDMHNNVKGIFGGDLFPSPYENIASKCGLYMDTIVLPDPFLRSSHMFQNMKDKDKAYYLLKHALNILQYKTLACTDIKYPIVVILPDIAQLDKDEREFIHSLGKQDSLIHSGKLFGRDFDSIEELLEFAEQLDTAERVAAAIKDESRVLFDTEWEGTPEEQIKRAMTDQHAEMLGTDHPGIIMASQSVGRMSVSNELLIKSRQLRGTPIIDAPTSWQYLAWKMEYDAEHVEKRDNIKELHIVRGLQNLAHGEMEWLGNVPPEALIEIRQQEAMDDIRGILGKGIEELTASNPNNFHRSHDQVFDNINEAFNQHKQNIKELRDKKWKFAGTDIGSWLVMGTLGVTAAATGMPVWGLAAIAADQLLDAPKLKNIPGAIKELVKENNKLNQSPVGLLFNVSKKA